MEESQLYHQSSFQEEPLTRAQLQREQLRLRSSFNTSSLEESSFTKSSFQKSRLQEHSFKESNFEEKSFNNSSLEESSFHKKSFDKKNFAESSFPTELAKLETSSLNTELGKAACSLELEKSFQSKLPLGGPDPKKDLAQGGVLTGSLPAYSLTDLGHHYMVAQACGVLLERMLALLLSLAESE